MSSFTGTTLPSLTPTNAAVHATNRATSLFAASERTRGSYVAGLLRFNHFCDLHSIPESARMPASEALLSMFVSSYGAGLVAAGTVSTWLSGLQLWHTVNLAPWHGGTLLSRTRKGVSKLAPESSRRPPRDPVMFDHMRTLRAGLDLTNSRDSAIWAAACVAWRGCARLGEVLIEAPSSVSSKNVTRGCPKRRGCASNNHRFIGVHLPWTKTKGAQGDWLTVTGTSDAADAVSALEHHLVVNSAVPDSAPLFAYITSSGWAHLSKADFISRCNIIWAAAGMEALNGHGFRIGGAMHLLLHGVDPWVVMKQGRWSSWAFLLYWRNVEEILPLFIGDSLDTFNSIKASINRLAQL
ncbi:DNA breaking-rejoining enzyme [Roridomyces roridus]|uniref:DNA breaking-rejoining enzyme n=1 Tax=Roridomyces roridus TaxID=1738132 RepID=A0AAD7FAW0_9AGAR|nr:DNA breaking-rejoining enzyme [Roridomyces roridus]